MWWAGALAPSFGTGQLNCASSRKQNAWMYLSNLEENPGRASKICYGLDGSNVTTG